MSAMEKTALQASLNTLDVWLIVFGLFVAIGAVGGSIAGYLHWRRSGQLQTLLEAENLAQQNAIAQADARALEAQVALEQLKAPRSLSLKEQQHITEEMAPFKGLRAVLGAVPPSERNTTFLSQILHVLKDAEVDAFINLPGVEASVSPTGFSNRGRLLTEGFPSGVTMYYVTGNDRGRTFSETLARALNGAGIAASAKGGRDEATMESRLKESGRTRNDKEFEPVVVAVGDKPV
jgi:hypothetical protein